MRELLLVEQFVVFFPLLTAPTLLVIVKATGAEETPDVKPGEKAVEEVTDGVHGNLRTKKWGRFCC